MIKYIFLTDLGRWILGASLAVLGSLFVAYGNKKITYNVGVTLFYIGLLVIIGMFIYTIIASILNLF